MAVSSYILPICVTSSIARFSPSSKWVLLESSRGFKSLKVTPIGSRGQRLGGSVLVRNSVLPDGTPVPSGSPDSWKSWVFGLLVTLIFPMWRSKIGPFALLKNKLDNVVQTAEDIAEVVEQVAEQVDKLAEEVSEHLPEGGKLRHAMDVLEDLAEGTAKKAHLLGEVIDKVQEVEDDLEELIEHPAMVVAAGAQADTVTATSTKEVGEEDDSNNDLKKTSTSSSS
uniref:Plastid-targeted protein 4 n=1 Tax=Kalanchoe fedtschenkoi TaxID=63787 RepID=A0A7N0UN40_KALFE